MKFEASNGGYFRVEFEKDKGGEYHFIIEQGHDYSNSKFIISNVSDLIHIRKEIDRAIGVMKDANNRK